MPRLPEVQSRLPLGRQPSTAPVSRNDPRTGAALCGQLGLAAVDASGLPKLIDAATVVVLPAVGGDVAPAVGPAPVGVGEVVRVCELAGTDDRARPAVDVVGLGERGYTSGYVGWRLGDPESGAPRHGVAPVGLGDAEVLQHLLRTQPARCHADGGDGKFTEFGSESLHNPLDIRLDEVVVEADVAPEIGIRV